jgi:DNA-binding GntR family transcriptional regulator
MKALDSRTGPRTLAEVALAELKEAIMSGELPPGSQVRLQEQVDRLSMSSVPIREALRYLERSGLVVRTPHRGAHVAEMSAQDLDETYSIRQELESMAVRLAAEHMDEETSARVQNLLEEYAEASRRGEHRAREIHGRLHMAIYEACGSKWLMRLIPMLWDNSERYRRLSLPVRGTLEDRIGEHRRIVEACRAHAPEAAAAALQEHLRHTFEAAILQLREQEATEEGRPNVGT